MSARKTKKLLTCQFDYEIHYHTVHKTDHVSLLISYYKSLLASNSKDKTNE